MADFPAIREKQVSLWLETKLKENSCDYDPPFNFELVPAGQSNLTFIVSDSGQNKWVLRRPPLSQVLSTAHDMTREFKIISALHPAGFPVPKPIALCEDESINDRPFYVMDFADGLIIRNQEIAGEIPSQTRQECGPALARTLAQLHAIDPDQVGLEQLAKKQDYIARQLKRWLGQFQQSKIPQDLRVEALHNYLSKNIPDQTQTGIVHGDYRLDNCVISPTSPTEVTAVLDWELCTLGDTLADLGTLCMYWAEPSEQDTALFDSPTKLPGFSARQELVDAYSEASGTDISSIDFYMAFANWRLVCILQGVYDRYLSGAMGDKISPISTDVMAGHIKVLIEKAEAYAGEI